MVFQHSLDGRTSLKYLAKKFKTFASAYKAEQLDDTFWDEFLPENPPTFTESLSYTNTVFAVCMLSFTLPHFPCPHNIPHLTYESPSIPLLHTFHEFSNILQSSTTDHQFGFPHPSPSPPCQLSRATSQLKLNPPVKSSCPPNTYQPSA